MPRDISGTYTLPLAPIEPRRIPVVNWVNPTVEDIAAALSNIPGSALAPGSVGTTQLKDNSVTNAKMAVNSVNTTELVDGAVTNAKMAVNSVNTTELVDGAVTNAKIQAQPTFSIRAGVDGPSGASVEFLRGGTRFGAVGNSAGGDEVFVVSDRDGITLIPNSLGTGTNDSVRLLKGQLQFPAAQNPSSDPNTLDDYEEGTFTPAISAATPGNLSVSYASQVGVYRKIGSLVFIYIALNFVPTYTTASGELIISGLPFPCIAEVPFSVSYFSGRASGTAPVARKRASDTSALRVADLLTNNTMAITVIPSGATAILLLSGSYYV